MKNIKKFISAILLFLVKLSYRIVSLVSILLLMLTVSIFLFFVFIKTSPNRAALFTTKFLERTLPVLKVKSEHISTKIHGENIEINIPHFKRHTKDVEIEGFDAKINFSISDILHGRLYKITIAKFLMNISTNKEKSTYNPHALASFYYSLIPSFKMSIMDFVLNLNDNKIHINDATLKVNQRGYILFVQANSKQYGYDFKVTLNSQHLHVSFNNIPSQILHKYTENKLNFLDFTNATGFIVFESKDTRNANFEIMLQTVSISKSNFINQQVSLSDLTIFGTSSANRFSIITSPFVINEKTNATLNILSNSGKYNIGFDIKNITIEEIKNIIALKNITIEPLKGALGYLEKSLKSGNISHCEGKIQTPVVENTDMMIKIAFNNITFEYHPSFATIEKANGSVEITPQKTKIFIPNSQSAGNVLKNSLVDITDGKVKIETETSGTMKSFMDIFKQDYLAIFPISANISAKTTLEIDQKCVNIYDCMKIISNGKLANFQTEFNNDLTNGTILFEKNSRESAVAKLNLSNFSNEYLALQNIEITATPSFDYKNLELKIDARNPNGDEILTKSIKINTQNSTLNEISISKIKFQQNDFALKFSDNTLELKGNSINLPKMYGFISKFRAIRDLIAKKPSQSSADSMKFNMPINRIIFHNNVEAFANIAVEMRGKAIQKAIIDSEILSFHYFPPEIEAKLPQELREQGLFIEIPDISMLISAVSVDQANVVKSGSMKLLGKRMQNNPQTIIWSGAIENLHTKSEKFKLNTRKIKILATQNGNKIEFNNLKVQDANHTIFITGTIFTDTMTIKAKIFYTPSKVEAVNEIAFIKEAIKVTSFGSSQNGILSLELDVSGSLFAPEVKFNKASSIKSLWKIIVSIPFLPFLIL